MQFFVSFWIALASIRGYTLLVLSIDRDFEFIVNALEAFLVGAVIDASLVSIAWILINLITPYTSKFLNISFLLKAVCTILLLINIFNAEYFFYFGGNIDPVTFSLFKDWFKSSDQFLGIGFFKSLILIMPIVLWWNLTPAFKATKLNSQSYLVLAILLSNLSFNNIVQPESEQLNSISKNFIHQLFWSQVQAFKATQIAPSSFRQHLGLTPDSYWNYYIPDYPLVKMTTHHAATLGLLEQAEWLKDRDLDGYPVFLDCDDTNFVVHPGAKDIPNNGIDEDCSGIDAGVPNIIFIHWEGARAVNLTGVGHGTPATPMFSKLARKGVLFTSMYANASITRSSLISIYCSTLPRFSKKWTFAYLQQTELLCFPEVLKNLGYQTVYMHSGDAGFAKKTTRLQQWFTSIYDRNNKPLKGKPKLGWGPTDQVLFEEAWKYLKQRKSTQPLMMSIVSLSNHYPFKLPKKHKPLKNHSDKKNQIANLIHYSDKHISKLITRILKDKKLRNSLIVVAGDHGLNWHAPKSYGQQDLLYEDLVWVNFALLGKNWRTTYGTKAEVRQLADIAPTILDQLGVKVPNPFIGHSLLNKLAESQQKAYFMSPYGSSHIGVRELGNKFFFSPNSSKSFYFDLAKDRKEQFNLAQQLSKEQLEEKQKNLTQINAFNNYLLENNRIWSDEFWLYRKKSN